ncbi:MAG: RNA methyltransferase [Rhodobacteraceae bacterium]|nr:RNA methyltransferase [Paracoccaceae bacterium]
MSGTDHAKLEDWQGPVPAIILVKPQMGENIGAAARAMWNFGLDRMRLVAPRDGWPNAKAVAMASGAGRVLDQITLADSTADALADLNFVFATTARKRDLTKVVMTPERAMAHAHALIADGQKVGIMFGPERAGLANEDIVQANAFISVPVNPAFASLNLAQSVLLLAYEWRRLAGQEDEVLDLSKTRFAEAGEVRAFTSHLQQRLDDVGFFFPEAKRISMIENLENMFGRLPLTDADVRTLHGVIKAIAERRHGPLGKGG